MRGHASIENLGMLSRDYAWTTTDSKKDIFIPLIIENFLFLQVISLERHAER